MFYFALDAADAADCHNLLANHGIVRDRPFAEAANDSTAESADEVIFRWDSISPRDLREAIEVVRGVIFFPPVRVWLGGKEYPLDDHVSGDIVPMSA
jgi:hypothetical protein